MPHTPPWACCAASGPTLNLSEPQILMGQMGTITPPHDNQASLAWQTFTATPPLHVLWVRWELYF